MSSPRFAALGAVVLPLALASLTPSPAEAQDGLEHRYQTWFSATIQGPLYGDLLFYADLHSRFYDSFEPYQVLLRPGLAYRLTPELFVTVAYAWTPAWRPSPDPRGWGDLDFTDEHRIWEQLLYQPSDAATGIGGQLRFRLEERFRPETSSEVALRLRLMARMQVPLTEDRALLFVLWDEAFLPVSDSDWGQHAGFDQNRLFVGYGWQALPGQLRVEVGYQNHWIVRPGTDSVNHVLAINTFVNWS